MENLRELDELVKNENVLCIVIFGSYLEKENPRDIDVIVIMQQRTKINLPKKFHVFAYTLEEFKELVYKGEGFLLVLFNEGLVKKGREVWEKFKRMFCVLHKDKRIEVFHKGKCYTVRDLCNS